MKIEYRIITATIILLAIGIMFPSIYALSNNEQENYSNNNLTNSSTEHTPYFSIKIPDDWTYETSSNSYTTELIGFGLINTIGLAPSELYAKHGFNFSSNSVASLFQQDAYYSIKNSPLKKYVEYRLEQIPRDIWNLTIIENIKIDNENATKIILDGIGSNTNYHMIGYFAIHNKEPYSILFGGYTENYNKYLPEFESMVDSFRFNK